MKKFKRVRFNSINEIEAKYDEENKIWWMPFEEDYILINPKLFITEEEEKNFKSYYFDESKWINELAQWCKSKIPAKENTWCYYMFYGTAEREIIYEYMIATNEICCYIDPRFNSNEQAILFLEQLNLPENKSRKDWFENKLLQKGQHLTRIF